VGYDISPLERVKLKNLIKNFNHKPSEFFLTTWATEGEFVSPII
jgi:hypothetical protein